MAQIEPKQAKPFGTIQTEIFLPKLAQFEPKCLAQLDRKGWRNSNRYIHLEILNEKNKQLVLKLKHLGLDKIIVLK